MSILSGRWVKRTDETGWHWWREARFGHQSRYGYPPEPESAKNARDCLERFAASVPSRKLDDARPAVSELVANSLCHASLSAKGGKISLHIEAADGMLGGKVCDTGRGFDPPPEVSPGEFLEGGWGLYLVDAVCQRWGVEKGEMFCVWFEVRL